MADPVGEADRSVRLDGDLGWMLGVVLRAYVKAADHVLHDLPGGPRGYQVLTAAVCEPPRNQGSIGEELGVDRTVLTYLIDDLERLDLVARRPDPADRRSRLVVATDAGHAAWRRRREALDRVEARVLDSLPAEDAATFRALLRRVAAGSQRRDRMDDLCAVVAEATADAAPGAGARARGGAAARGGAGARGRPVAGRPSGAAARPSTAPDPAG